MYLQMRAHMNASMFFKHYGEMHPEFDSQEQCEKRDKLANEIRDEIFGYCNLNNKD